MPVAPFLTEHGHDPLAVRSAVMHLENPVGLDTGRPVRATSAKVSGGIPTAASLLGGTTSVPAMTEGEGNDSRSSPHRERPRLSRH